MRAASRVHRKQTLMTLTQSGTTSSRGLHLAGPLAGGKGPQDLGTEAAGANRRERPGCPRAGAPAAGTREPGEGCSLPALGCPSPASAAPPDFRRQSHQAFINLKLDSKWCVHSNTLIAKQDRDLDTY